MTASEAPATAIPDAAVAAAARAGWESDRWASEPGWADLAPVTVDTHLARTRVVLEAALPYLAAAILGQAADAYEADIRATRNIHPEQALGWPHTDLVHWLRTHAERTGATS